MRLVGVRDSHIFDVDVSWDGAGKTGMGIDLKWSFGNTIEYVSATNRHYGLRMDSSYEVSRRNTIQHNDFSGAYYYGIEALYSRGAGNKYLDNNLSGTEREFSLAINTATRPGLARQSTSRRTTGSSVDLPRQTKTGRGESTCFPATRFRRTASQS